MSPGDGTQSRYKEMSEVREEGVPHAALVFALPRVFLKFSRIHEAFYTTGFNEPVFS